MSEGAGRPLLLRRPRPHLRTSVRICAAPSVTCHSAPQAVRDRHLPEGGGRWPHCCTVGPSPAPRCWHLPCAGHSETAHEHRHPPERPLLVRRGARGALVSAPRVAHPVGSGRPRRGPSNPATLCGRSFPIREAVATSARSGGTGSAMSMPRRAWSQSGTISVSHRGGGATAVRTSAERSRRTLTAAASSCRPSVCDGSRPVSSTMRLSR